ncbi:MAG: CBS domain-containing protein [Bacteriovorax sp.]
MNQVKDIMTKDPVCCLPTTSLKSVAQLMVKHDCGEIPVVYSMDRTKVVGVITDRDICCRTVARGLNPLEMTAEECMSTPAKVVKMDMSIPDCCELMEEEQIRRVPVVDDNECVCGMVSLADIARKSEEFRLAPILKHISEPRHLS